MKDEALVGSGEWMLMIENRYTVQPNLRGWTLKSLTRVYVSLPLPFELADEPLVY